MHPFLLPQEPERRALERAWEYFDRYYYNQGEQGVALHELAANAPPLSLKRASILVNSAPCDDCVSFTNVVNARLDLCITVQHNTNDR